MIHIQGLHKRYPGRASPALDSVDLTIDDGQVFGILGANGAGKSTLIKVLAGLTRKDGGTISVNGLDWDGDHRKVKAQFGLVPQTAAFYPTLTVDENLDVFIAAHGLRRGQSGPERARVLEITGLMDRRKSLVNQLSGGMQRRLNLAIGLLGNPRILCMDEPTVGIDPQSRDVLLETIKQLANDGMTVIYTSHYMDEMQDICHTLAIMEEGRVLASGSLAKLISTTPRRFTVTFPPHVDASRVSALASRLGGRSVDTHRIELPTTDTIDDLRMLLNALDSTGISPGAIRYGNQDLQEVLSQLTSRCARS